MTTKIPRVMLEGGAVGFADIDPDDIATKEEAEAGEANDKLMTPQGVKDAIAAYGPGGAPIWTFYDAGTAIEEVATLPVPTSGGPYFVIARLGPIVCKAGDVIDVSGQVQYTNPRTYVVGVTSAVRLTTTPNTPNTGTIIYRPSGRNITPTPGTHHDPHALVGKCLAPADNIYWVVISGRAYSTQGGSGQTINVDQQYSKLAVTQFHNHS